jgi:hypothetical protein
MVGQSQQAAHVAGLNMAYTHLTIDIHFVGHGFQMDMYDRTQSMPGGGGIIRQTECHDFTDTQPSICDRAEQARKAITAAMRGITSLNP